MLKVLIAEDEMLVRMGLSVSIDWSRYDLQLAAECSNGDDAYHAFLTYRPDIILTDIRMPGMDGLTLISKIREVDTGCRIIIITCMTDFATLHEAMQYGISCYLIKATMTGDDINEAISKAVGECSERRSLPADEQTLDRQRLISAMTDYLVLCSINYERFAARLEADAVPMPEPSGILTIYWQPEEAKPIMLKSLCRLIVNRLKEKSEVRYFICEKYLLFQTDAYLSGDVAQELASLNDTDAFINENFMQRLRFIYSTEKVSVRDLPAYLDTVRTVSLRSYLFDAPVTSVNAQGEVCVNEFDQWILQMRDHSLSMRTNPRLYDEYNTALDRLKKAIGMPRTTLLSCMYEVTTLLAQNQPSITSLALNHCHEYLAQAQSLRSMISIIDKQLLLNQDAEQKPNTHLLSKALQYMYDHISSDLTLNQVASYVNLSPGYFSTLLKNETGMRYAEFLSDLRLKRAQDLLKNGEMSVYDVAVVCGYQDIAYFSRCFKKRFGVSPSKWRQP